MNILFLGGGRRNSLCERFQKHGFKVFSYELDLNAPIAKTCDKIILGLKWNDTNIEEHILSTINDNNIDVIIPLQDHAVSILSKMDIDGKVVSNYDTANICYDKKSFENAFDKNNSIRYIYPFVIDSSDDFIEKPRFGFNSKGISINKITNKQESVYQRYIKGTEYSVDAYYDRENNLIDFVPRVRTAVCGGEVVISSVLSSKTVERSRIENYLIRISEVIKFTGPICFQFIVDNKSKQVFIMEINARFGGGVILSIEAGLDIPKMIKEEYIDCKNPTRTFINENLTMSRYFSEYFHAQ